MLPCAANRQAISLSQPAASRDCFRQELLLPQKLLAARNYVPRLPQESEKIHTVLNSSMKNRHLFLPPFAPARSAHTRNEK